MRFPRKRQDGEDILTRTCVTPDAKILLDDKITRITIHELEQRLASVNVTSFDVSRGYYFPCRVKSCRREDAHAKDKRVIYIATITGRSIKVTDDHLFYTFGRRWHPAGFLQKGDRIAVYPTIDPLEEHPFHDKWKNSNSFRRPIKFLKKSRIPTLISIEDFIPLMRKNTFSQFTLTFKKNLPLTLEHELLPVWARLLGYIITRVRFNEDIILTFHDEKDWMDIQKDLQKIGIRARSSRKDGINFIMLDSTVLEIFNLLIKPNKTPLSRNEPLGWISQAPLTVMREFLGGLIGSTGKSPWIDILPSGNEKLTTPRLLIRFNDDKLQAISENIISLIIQFFEKFGITLEMKRERNDDEKDLGYLLLIPENDVSSLELLTRFIGVRYNTVESIKNNFVAEYFRFLEFVNSKEGKRIPELVNSKFPSIDDFGPNQSQKVNEVSRSLNELSNNDHVASKDDNTKSLPPAIQSEGQNERLEESSKQQAHPPTSILSEEDEFEIDGDLFVWQIESQTITSFQDFLYACRADFETGMLHEPIAILGDVMDKEVRKITVTSHTQIYIINGFFCR